MAFTVNRDRATPAALLSPGARGLLVAIVAILSLPGAVGLYTDHDVRSRWERRPLEPAPDWRGVLESSDYFAAFGRFADDHVGFALQANRLLRQVLFYVFADDPAANITVGRNGFVFLNSHYPDRPHDVFQALCIDGVNEERYEELVAEIKSTFDWLQSRDYRPSLGIAVTKPVLYPEHLPLKVPAKYRDNCRAYAGRSNIPRRLSALGRSPERVIFYPFAEFTAQRATRAFFPKENFHWSGMSAHLFARALLLELGIHAGAEYDAGAALASVPADVPQFLGFPRQVSVWRFPYEAYRLEWLPRKPDVVQEYYENSWDYSTWRSAEPLSERRALLVSNSFGVDVAEHLAPGFRTLIHVNVNHLQPHEWNDFFGALLDRLDVTDVIFLLHDDALVRNHIFMAMGQMGGQRPPLSVEIRQR